MLLPFRRAVRKSGNRVKRGFLVELFDHLVELIDEQLKVPFKVRVIARHRNFDRGGAGSAIVKFNPSMALLKVLLDDCTNVPPLSAVDPIAIRAFERRWSPMFVFPHRPINRDPTNRP